MYFRSIGPAILIAFFSTAAQAKLEIAANFWNLGWQGTKSYCSGTWGNWNAEFVSQIQIYRCLRFMDWNMVNNNEAGQWAKRVKKEDGCTQASDPYRPIAYEWMIDVVNLVPGCAFWVTVPARANEEYVTNLAILTHQLLGPGRKVYLEYANETWWEPASCPVVAAAGRSIPGITLNGNIARVGPNNSVWIDKVYLGHAYLAVQMWSWFRKAWVADGGDSALLVNVLAGLVGFGDGEEAHGMLEALKDKRVNSYGLSCDAFAVAPYWRGGNPVHNEKQLADHYKWTQQYGCSLVLYEGGPGEDQVKATPAQMTQFLTMADKYVDGPYCHYCHSGGSWGAVENGYYPAFVDWSEAHPSAAGPWNSGRRREPCRLLPVIDKEVIPNAVLFNGRVAAIPQRKQSAGVFAVDARPVVMVPGGR